MKTEKRPQKNSAAKRLIPAAAMLLASATMLSTATYAWFTMNKEVKLEGLQMTATTGEGIEISLASVTGENNTLNFTGSPSDGTEEKGWKSNVAVGDYYESIGKVMPASSVDGDKFFEATDAFDSGKQANAFASVTTKCQILARSELSPGTAVNSSEQTGYYVDIPVHIRTSKVKPTGSEAEGESIYCKAILKNISGDAQTNSLFKAVRVAFIPSEGQSAKAILGADNEYYTARKAISSDGSGGTSTHSDVNVKTAYVSSTDAFVAGAGEDTGLDITYATGAGSYGHLDFIVRVWLEGESTSCYDEKAGQSWKIDLAFSLGEFEDPAP